MSSHRTKGQCGSLVVCAPLIADMRQALRIHGTPGGVTVPLTYGQGHFGFTQYTRTLQVDCTTPILKQ